MTDTLDNFMMARLASVTARELGRAEARMSDVVLEMKLLAVTDPETGTLLEECPEAVLHIRVGSTEEPRRKKISAWAELDGSRLCLSGLQEDLEFRQSHGCWNGAGTDIELEFPLGSVFSEDVDRHTKMHIGAAGRRLRHLAKLT